MITHVDIRLLCDADRATVLDLYRKALASPGHAMTLKECAWLYGYNYGTLRSHAHSGRLATKGSGNARRITHGHMRAFLRSKKKTGRPRKALTNAQIQLS